MSLQSLLLVLLSAIAIGTVCWLFFKWACRLCALRDRTKPRGSRAAEEYDKAGDTIEMYTERAVDIYKILDPEKRLISDDDPVTYRLSHVLFMFKGGNGPESMAVLTIHWEDGEEYPNTLREVWFPFELLDAEISDIADETFLRNNLIVEWSEQTFAYGGGKCIKMMCRMKDSYRD